MRRRATFALNDETEEREIGGIRDAMRRLKRKLGWIVTLEDEDELDFDEGVVKVVPFHKFKAEDALSGDVK